jgi:NAD(P)H-hydrate epimerase
MRQAERRAIASGVPALDLMERAGTEAAQWLLDPDRSKTVRPSPGGVYRVLCGPGDNGGDGMVVARHLHLGGHSVTVHRLAESGPSEACHVQWERMKAAGVPVHPIIGEVPDVASGDLVVDALFGIGLNRPLEGPVVAWVEAVRTAGVQVVALDVPSGMDGDGRVQGPVMGATATLTFQWPKVATLLPANADLVGALVVLPIGIAEGSEAQEDMRWYLQDRSDLRELIHPRPNAGHKGSFGHAVLVGGSTGRMGAMVLAVRSCSRSGVGTVTAHVPADGLPIVQAAWPEAMGSPDVSRGHVSDVPRTLHGMAWGIGPGLGSDPDSALMLKRMIQDPPGGLVLDADALNLLAEAPTWTAFLPAGTILTPHVREFERLAGSTFANDRDRWEAARELAARWGCVLVLKGATTAICAPQGRLFVQRWANSGMARGGSGDVLTGLVTGLLAQGYSPLAAASVGVYLHGAAGAMVAASLGPDGMSVHDLVEAIPAAWRDLRS